ncbi:MAG: branched-chain amino acid ABC transporter permease [Clostridia bacterium]
MSALAEMVLTQIFINVIAVTGVYVLTGLTGMFSLGQAAFMAIGAYVSGVAVTKYAVSIWLAIPLAVAVALLIGLMVGFPTARLRRDYISLITLGFGEALTALLNKFNTLTGGAQGMVGIPKLVTLPVVCISAVVAIALVAMFKTSKYGRQCIAVRSDELSAKAMGINVPRVKLTAFLFSVAITAYSGCMYAFYITYVDPTLFGWKRSADWVIMVFFGGINSLSGSVVASFLLTGLPELLREFSVFRYIIYAVLVLLIINFKPDGLLGSMELTPRSVLRAVENRKRKNKKKGEIKDAA